MAQESSGSHRPEKKKKSDSLLLEYFNLPTAIVVAIAVIFLIAEVIKGILTIKNGAEFICSVFYFSN